MAKLFALTEEEIKKSILTDKEHDLKILGSSGARYRKINMIVKKLTQWVIMYNGVIYTDENGRECFRYYNLEESANELGMSRRTLDEYRE